MNNYTITSPISGTIIEKDAKQGDALTSGSTLCVIYDLSYLEMVINVMSCRSAHCPWARKVQLTADRCDGQDLCRHSYPCVHEGQLQRRHHDLPHHHPHR